MNYCSDCGSSLRHAIPEGDDRLRFLCDACGTIHYQNPKIIAGCIPVWRDRILLCQRAIEPRKGFWTLPAGFMELGETMSEAALRETREEANAEVAIEGLHSMFSLPHISQVYVFFRARMLNDRFFPGAESLATRLFSEGDVPWNALAFSSVRRSLELFFEDRQAGHFTVRVEDIDRPRESTTLNHQSDVA